MARKYFLLSVRKLVIQELRKLENLKWKGKNIQDQLKTIKGIKTRAEYYKTFLTAKEKAAWNDRNIIDYNKVRISYMNAFGMCLYFIKLYKYKLCT